MLEIKPSIQEMLPTTVKSALTKMTVEQQQMFQQEFEKKSKSKGLYIVLAILFPIQLFLLGKTGLGIAFILTGMGCFIWYLVEIFLTPKRVREYNKDLATQILTNLKMMSA